MKKISFLSLTFFVALTFLAGKGYAATPTQCSIDKSVTVGEQNFAQCPLSDKNNAILLQGFNGVRLDPDITTSQTAIWAHDICHYVDARGLQNPIFIPLNTAQEWMAFLANKPADIHVANCCLPRALRVSDVPMPTETCVSGSWRLKGLVDPNERTTLLATPSTRDDTFVLASNNQDNSTAITTTLPVARDDMDKTVSNYVGQYVCGSAQESFVEFNMQCNAANWHSTSASLVAEPVAAAAVMITPEPVAQNAQVAADASACTFTDILVTSKPCPAPSSRLIVTRKVYNSCTKNIEMQISNNCTSVAGCLASSEIRTTPCNNGSNGTLVQNFQHVCDGSHGGDGFDLITDISNSCAYANPAPNPNPTSPPVITGCLAGSSTSTLPCPGGAIGNIIQTTTTVCDGSNGGAGQTTTVNTSSTCSTIQSGGGLDLCTQSVILNFTSPCAFNQTGVITKRKVFNSCTGMIETQTISNTCG